MSWGILTILQCTVMHCTALISLYCCTVLGCICIAWTTHTHSIATHSCTVLGWLYCYSLNSDAPGALYCTDLHCTAALHRGVAVLLGLHRQYTAHSPTLTSLPLTAALCCTGVWYTAPNIVAHNDTALHYTAMHWGVILLCTVMHWGASVLFGLHSAHSPMLTPLPVTAALWDTTLHCTALEYRYTLYCTEVHLYCSLMLTHAHSIATNSCTVLHWYIATLDCTAPGCICIAYTVYKHYQLPLRERCKKKNWKKTNKC